MSEAFRYQPKFIDIRIRPPETETKRKPEERDCVWAGCVSKAASRAPKGPDRLRDYYWFCTKHAATYNKSWNFFSGMNDAEMRAYQEAVIFGHRPTWSMKVGDGATGRADRYAKASKGAFSDPFGLFGDKEEAAKPKKRRHGRIVLKALEAMSLGEEADPAEVRTRYTEMIKRFHPDANGGDRSMEEKLLAVIRAYQTLKTAGLAG